MFEHKMIRRLAFSLIDSNQTISDDFFPSIRKKQKVLERD